MTGRDLIARVCPLRDHWRVIPANSSRQEKWLEVIEALQANMSGALDSMRKVHCPQVR